MAKPYSEDLRERAIEKIKEGMTQSAVARLLRLGKRTVERYEAQWKAEGHVKPKKVGGHKKHKLEPHTAKVEALVAEEPDQTLAELRDKLEEAKIKVSKSALDRFLKASGLTYKKNSGGERTKTQGRGRRSRRVA